VISMAGEVQRLSRQASHPDARDWLTAGPIRQSSSPVSTIEIIVNAGAYCSRRSMPG